MARKAVVGQSLLTVEVSQSHSETPHPVGHLWTSDQPEAETTHNTHKRQTTVPPAAFGLAVPGSDRPQTHVH
jgi:hypothetical protein